MATSKIQSPDDSLLSRCHWYGISVHPHSEINQFLPGMMPFTWFFGII